MNQIVAALRNKVMDQLIINMTAWIGKDFTIS